jgi:hypothetical protein
MRAEGRVLVQPPLGVSHVASPVAVAGEVDPDGRARPDVNVHVVAARVEPAAQARAGSLKPAAVLKEGAVLDAVDPRVGGVADLVIARQRRLRAAGWAA